jgi:potassium/chloride transporter 9
MAEGGEKPISSIGRSTLSRTLTRGRPTFLTRTATDDAAQLLRRSSLPAPVPSEQRDTTSQVDGAEANPYEARTNASDVRPREHELTKKAFRGILRQDSGETQTVDQANRSRRRVSNGGEANDVPSNHRHHENKQRMEKTHMPKVGSVPRPIGGTEKMGTFSGVFVPTSLNVLSILMFLRFGFILGQAGVLGMFGMLAAAYLINLVTTMSISAIASNGTVRGGGAYYLISRSLGPEFGGSIGIVFYMGFVFNTGMNAVGLVDCLNQNFGSVAGNWATFLIEGYWWQYLWSNLILIICTGICLAGSSVFARASNGLLIILLVATLSIPFSALVMRPFELSSPQFVQFTGLSLSTLKDNFKPRFTKGAAGSQLKGRENYQDLFGILFPATGGIFAGASMSGDLKNPSKSIPKGTLYGLALTFVSYALVILAMAASITRESLHRNVNVIQDTNLSGVLILLGEFATTFFSALMGVIGPAKLLQAIARDGVLPGLSIFSQGTRSNDEPTYAILFTYAVAQATMLFDINRIASFITMIYLMTFFVTNLACFLLKISSAPNFRPSFHYFNWWTAASGAVLSVVTMFFVDGNYATGCIGILIILFLLIHYTTPPKSWGDVSQSLIYHQVRKYLLRLRNEHVKFWRPQILLFVNDPRRGYKLIQFCNSLKKGSLFILGHVIVTSNFGASVPEARRQQAAWTKYIDFSKIKAFVNVAISPSAEWGTRNIVLSAGLGGMRPNIVIMGFYNIEQFRREQPLVDVPSPPPERKGHKDGLKRRKRSRSQLKGDLPTDKLHLEGRMDIQSYVMVLEDLLLKLQINVAIAVGFQDLELPNPQEGNTKKYIDLWPIQMSAEITSESDQQKNLMTTNFDTYTMILQLGCILNTVPSWKKSYKLRVAVFVEYESDVVEERERVTSLLENLRIEAEVLVFWLASGEVKSYEMIVNGADVDEEVETQVEKLLEDENWWADLRRLRGKVTNGEISAVDQLSIAEEIQWPIPSYQNNAREPSMVRFEGLRRLLRQGHRRRSFGNLSSLGVSLNMRTHRLDDDLISRHASHASASETSDSSDTESLSSANADEGSEPEDEGSTVVSASADDEAEERNTISEGNTRPSSRASKKMISSKLSSKKSSITSSKRSKGSKNIQAWDDSHPSSALSKENLNVFDMGNPLIDTGEPSSITEENRGRQGQQSSNLHVEPTVSQSISPGDRIHSRASSRVKFSSSPVPIARVASNEATGPSIMFAESPHPRRNRSEAPQTQMPQASPQQRSIYTRDHSTANSASGYPSAAAVPLSFNDLPCRAQHLILNELITQHSEDTAVIFTTLPAPVEGTYKSESDCLAYVSDLEVLCGGLPPTLLVHSNSMTVTTNL